MKLASEAKEAEADEFVKDVLLRGFIAGDLAYFEILLGKEGADSAWCPWCKLSHRQWQVIKSAAKPSVIHSTCICIHMIHFLLFTGSS